MPTEEPLAFDVWCSRQATAQAAIGHLQDAAYRYDPNATLTLLLDMPRGFALQTLEEVNPANRRLIVVTYSFCAEYWEDLWDLQPLGLIVDDTYDHSYIPRLRVAASGARFRLAPAERTPLSPAERQVLRYAARGWSNKRIATMLALQEKTVLNSLSSVYAKLGVANRTEATLHYWDICHTFKEPPQLIMG